MGSQASLPIAHLCFRVSSKCYNGFAKDCRDLGSTARWPLRKIGCSGSNWLRDGFQMDINYSPKPSLSIFKKHRKLTDVVLFVLPQSFQNDVFLQFVGDHLIPAGSFFRKKEIYGYKGCHFLSLGMEMKKNLAILIPLLISLINLIPYRFSLGYYWLCFDSYHHRLHAFTFLHKITLKHIVS